MINPLDYPICLTIPQRLTKFSDWQQHIPFGMFLVHLSEPRIIVELGTLYGDSYCAFCQAVSENNLKTTCFAIDTWAGDPHVGFYGPDILEELRLHHDPRYGSFSRLISSTFDEALQHFEDRTIDLLHIDGYHTYDAVRHDFESWKPKLSSRGVILFHDTNVRERDFGVWKLWEEAKEEYPHFEFTHGHGLGVLAVGAEQTANLKEWLEDAGRNTVATRNYFFAMGHRLEVLRKNLQLEERVQALEQESMRRSEQIKKLDAFADAVRRTFVYRLYRSFVKPFRSELKI